MATTLESIPATLGGLRAGLIDKGFSESEAFQITLDLIRRGVDTPPWLLDRA